MLTKHLNETLHPGIFNVRIMDICKAEYGLI